MDDSISVMYVKAKSALVSLGISGGTADCVTNVRLISKGNISISMKLQKKSGSSWQTVKTWSKSGTDVLLLKLSKSCSVSKGTYRVHTVINADGEKITKNTSSKTY